MASRVPCGPIRLLDRSRDAGDFSIREPRPRRQIQAFAAQRFRDGKMLSAKAMKINRLQMKRHEKRAGLDAARGEAASQFVARAPEIAAHAHAIRPEHAS